MTTAHDDMLDQVALLALGVLPQSDASAVAAHARVCDECRAEYIDLRAAADAVPCSAELQLGELDEVSAARMKSKVMSLVRATNGTAVRAGAPHAVTVAPTPVVAPALIVPIRSRLAWLPYLVAAAAVIVAILSSANLAVLRSQSNQVSQQVATLQTQVNEQQKAANREREMETRLAALTAPGSKHFTVPSGEVVTSGGHVYMALHVAALAPGKVYQAWTLRTGTKSVAPSVTFVPEADGVAYVELPESSSGLAAVAVSVEPAGGSKAPTSTPSFVRTLS